MQAVREILGHPDSIASPATVFAALRDDETGPKVRERHRLIMRSPDGQAANAAIDDSMNDEEKAERWQAVYRAGIVDPPAS